VCRICTRLRSEAFFRKRTPGSRDLRRIMRNFWLYDASLDPMCWGPIFAGEDERAVASMRWGASPTGRMHLRDIATGEMALPVAELVLRELDVQRPWYTIDAFLEALAALSAVHRADMGRKTCQAGLTVARLLVNIGSHPRVRWLFNALRLLHALPRKFHGLTGTGTTSNEAFHHQLNSWYRHGAETFSTTVALQLRFATLGAQLSHVTAHQRPFLRQLRPNEVLARRIGIIAFPAKQWEAWCSAQSRGRPRLAQACLELASERARLARMIQAYDPSVGQSDAPLKRPASGMRKRPASLVPRGARVLKRTVFTLKRAGSLTPPHLQTSVRRRRPRSKSDP